MSTFLLLPSQTLLLVCIALGMLWVFTLYALWRTYRIAHEILQTVQDMEKVSHGEAISDTHDL
jgi:uncharacterized membrane protein YqjE